MPKRKVLVVDYNKGPSMREAVQEMAQIPALQPLIAMTAAVGWVPSAGMMDIRIPMMRERVENVPKRKYYKKPRQHHRHVVRRLG